jgi:hypothetical protein
VPRVSFNKCACSIGSVYGDESVYLLKRQGWGGGLEGERTLEIPSSLHLYSRSKVL